MRKRVVDPAYSMQFRWEEDRLVYRYKRRGAPIEVTEAERDWALQRYTRLQNRILIGWWLFVFLAMVIVPLSLRPIGYAALVLGGMFVSFGISLWMLLDWAWKEPTRAWRKRPAIGEPLGRTGALVMLTEKLSWPDIMIGFVLIPFGLAGIVASPQTRPEWPPEASPTWLVILVGVGALLFHVVIAFLKLALHERDALRARRRRELDSARELFKETD